jgi:hypothetical protein
MLDANRFLPFPVPTSAKCQDCKCQITLSNFHKSEEGGKTLLLCKTHFFTRFNEVRLAALCVFPTCRPLLT